MTEVIGAITADTIEFVRKIHIAGLVELLELVLGGDLPQHLRQLVMFEFVEFDRLQVAVNPKAWLDPTGHMKVGRALRVHQPKECVNLGHGMPLAGFAKQLSGRREPSQRWRRRQQASCCLDLLSSGGGGGSERTAGSRLPARQHATLEPWFAVRAPVNPMGLAWSNGVET